MSRAPRPESLDNIIVGLNRRAGASDGVLASVAALLERRHFVAEVKTVGDDDLARVGEGTVIVIAAGTATLGDATEAAAQLEGRGVPAVVLVPSAAVPDSGSDVVVIAADGPEITPRALAAIEEGLCGNPLQLSGRPGNGPVQCAC